ncbi:Phosphotransferase enzyme family protein [Variovorax sp. PDC80]|uniref:phosphotransferase family protein n=1 Tax=Variovorax sp. PDC80 TaxID=1882827 RepID=UPI0008DEEE90|nr:aminoglycoside phosphotransferase family protein [Variovorax sp. PDC80]SFN99350.1 Phosphotransferase enzyme family protein [Variovorax sp. PDC80]
MEPDEGVRQFFLRAGLGQPGEPVQWTPLAGGVSSDIWRVKTPAREICIKRALPKLKVAANWEAPVSRNAFEWDWLQFAAKHVPQAVPEPLAHDPVEGLFAMAFLPAEDYPLWKAQLLAGRVQATTAASVGSILAKLHSASAADPSTRSRFDTTDNFYALRLEPYLMETGRKHPELAPHLSALVETTAATRHALVHGDVSPKNILVGPDSPVLLDAECAWFGDPAFDLAFCLNHLLLKCLVRPAQRGPLLNAFHALRASYLASVDWELATNVEARAAALLPALLLARVDGKSPVEYLTSERAKDLVRACAVPLVRQPAAALETVRAAWQAILESQPL